MKNTLKVCLLAVFLSGCSSSQEQALENPMLRVAQKARKSGNSEAATSFYNKAVEMNPNSPDAYLGLAECYIDMKLLDAALEYIKKAEERKCDLRRSAYLRGKILLLSGESAKAEKEFMKSKSVDALNALGAVYDGRGQHKEAQAFYKQVISRDPNYIDAYNNMGLSLMLCDKYKEAIFYLESACSLPESSSAYRSNLALVYGLSGNIPKAREVYAQDYEGNELEEKVAYLQDLLAAKQK